MDNVGSLPNASTAANKRKRRSSILKIQRPPRTPFSELEFDVATPTDVTKSRRVSFSRRTGVAEFITNEATTTWKNLYEQQNKSLESSGHDSEVNVPFASSLFTQSIDQVYTEHTVFNETTNLKETHLSFTNLGLTSLTDQHSTLFKNDITNPTSVEVTGGISMNFSEVNTAKDDEDDLDAIERQLAEQQENGVSKPFADQSMSQYMEVFMNKTYGPMTDSLVSDMSITDTIHNPKVQGNFPKEKDWVEDKENMIINPYVSPPESDNFAINKSTEKVLVFDGKKLKYADINADLDKIVSNASPVKDKSKSLIENDMSMTKCLTNVCMINNDDMSMTTVVNKTKEEYVNMSMTAAIPNPECMIKNYNESMEEDMSLTKMINEVASVIGNVTANVDMSMTKGVTNIVCLTNNSSQKDPDSGEADMSLTKVVKGLVAEPGASNLSLGSQVLSQTRVFETDDVDLSFTQCVLTSQRKNIIIENNDRTADMSITESLNNVNQDMSSKNRQTLLFDDSMGDISMTQAIPAQIIANQTENLTANNMSFGGRRNDHVLLVYQTTVNNENMKPVPESGASTTSADSGHASLTPVADSSAAATEIMQFPPPLERDLGLENQYQHVTLRESTVSDNYETTEPAKLSPSSKGDDFHASSQKINKQFAILDNPHVTSHTTAAPKVISKRPAEQVESRCEEAIKSISYDKMATSSCKINKDRSEGSHSTEVESSEQFKTNNAIPSNSSGFSMKLEKEKSRISIGMEEDSKISALYDSNSGSNNKEISSSEPPSKADPPPEQKMPLPPKNVIDTLLDMSNASHESGLGDRYLVASLNTSVTPKVNILGTQPPESLINDIPRDNELLFHKTANEPITAREENRLQESVKEKEQVTSTPKSPNSTRPEVEQVGSQQANLTSPNKLDQRKTVPVSPTKNVVEPKSSKLSDQSLQHKTNISNRSSNVPLRRSSKTSSEINQPSPKQAGRISSKITTPRTTLRQMMPKAGRVSPNAPNVPTSLIANAQMSPKTGNQMLAKIGSQMLPKTGSQMIPKSGSLMLPKTGSLMSPKFGSQTSPKSPSHTSPKSASPMSNNSACPMPPKCDSQMSPTPPSHVSSISTGETATSAVYEMVSTANSPILSLQTLQDSSKTENSLVSTGVSPISGRSINKLQSNSNSPNTSGKRSRSSPRSSARYSLGSSSRTSPRSSGRNSIKSSRRSSPSRKSCTVCEVQEHQIQDGVIPIIEGGSDDEEDNTEAQNKMMQHKIERSIKERSFRQELKLTLQKLKEKTDHVTPILGKLFDKVLPQQPRITEKLPQLIPEPIYASSGTKSPNDTEELLESISSITGNDKESDIAPNDSVDSVRKGALKTSGDTLIGNDVMKSPRISLCDTVPLKLQKHVRLREELTSNPETDDSTSELESCPLTALKKTAFGESTYVKDHKIKVIPNYLEGVTEEIKDLMDDLVKPLADVMPPFQTGAGHAPLKARASHHGKSLCHSASIQADLMPSSQIDLSLHSDSNLTAGESIYSMVSTSREPSEYRPENMVHMHQRQPDTNFILPFDSSNPVNNIFLGPAAGHVHKYSPVHSVVSSMTSKVSTAPSSDEGTDTLSNDVDVSRRDVDVERVEVSFQLSRCELPTVPEVVHYSEKYVSVNLMPESNTSRVESSHNTVSIDGCTAPSVTELKDAEINTAIVMKPYKQLLEVSSSLTLVDSVNGLDVPPAKKESEEFHDSRTGDEDRSVYEDAPATTTPIVPDVALKKRSRSPITPKNKKSTISYDLKSPMSKTIKTEQEKDQNKSSEKIQKKEKPKKKPLYAPGVYDTQRQLDPYWMPKTSKLTKIPKNRKLTVQNLFTEPFNVNDIMNHVPSADRMTESTESNFIDPRESFTSSKDMDDRDVISEGPMDANWVFAHELAEYGDKYNVVAKIDMLPFLGTNLCLWDSSSQSEGDNWSFILMNGQIRLLVRLEYKSDNATRTRVSASTKVIGVSAERTLQNIANPIHVLATKLAVESMGGVCGERWPVAGAVPELIRRCVVVASRANTWATVMSEAQLRLGYKVNSKAQVKLQIANVPLASVWVVSFDIAVAKGVKELFPRAENLTVHDVYTRFPISMAETRRLLADVKEDWGHVPNTLWKVFRYIKNRNKGDIEVS